MSQEITSQLNKIRDLNSRINPDQAWVVQNRQKLMSQINNTVNAETVKSGFSWDKFWSLTGIFFPGKFAQQVLQPVAMFALLFVFITGGWIASAGATANCLPGDICYGVKLATEKTQEMVLSVTGSGESQTQLQLEFAGRRADEFKKVVEHSSSNTSENATLAIKHLQDSIKSASDRLKDVNEVDPQKAVDLTKDLNDKTGEIAITLKTATQATSTDPSISKEVADTNKILNEASITAIEVVVQNQADGKLVDSQAKVKDLVEKKIDSIISDINNSNLVADNLKNLSDATSTSTSLVLPIVAGSVSSSILSTNMEQAKDLVNNDQLLAAVQKVKDGIEIVVGEIASSTTSSTNTIANVNSSATDNTSTTTSTSSTTSSR